MSGVMIIGDKRGRTFFVNFIKTIFKAIFHSTQERMRAFGYQNL